MLLVGAGFQLASTELTSTVLDQANRDFRARRFTEAEARLRDLLESVPDSGPARYLLVRSLIRRNEPRAAVQEAEAAQRISPRDAFSHVAMGDALFRAGEFEKAAVSYVQAQRLDETLARAYWGHGRVLETRGRLLSAKESFRKAYELDPEDPDIIGTWARVLPRSPEETKLWERYVAEATYLEPQILTGIRAYLELLKRKPQTRLMVLEAAPEAVQIPLRPFMRLPEQRVDGWAIEVRVNGRKPRRMLLDTGSSGILMVAKDGQKDGVEMLAASNVLGVGDQGPALSSLGWAERVTIGPLTWSNCPIRMMEKRAWGSAEDGIIGTDVFHDFRITIDPSKLSLSLEKLPELAGDSRYSHDASDREPGTSAKIRLVEGKILVSGLLNEKESGLFLIDTGANQSMVDRDSARAVTGVRSTRANVKGLSGRVRDVAEAINLSIQFAGVRQSHPSIPVFDLDRLSHDLGTEVKALIGARLLQKVKLTIDYREALIWVDPVF